MTNPATYRDSFLEAMSELHHAESQLLEVLPVLASNASNPELKSAFKTHFGQTRAQATRLDDIFHELGEPVRDYGRDSAAPLLAAARESTAPARDQVARDTALIAAAQAIEYYAVGAYGRACTYARLLGLERANELLYTSLHEVALSSVLLSELARNLDGLARTLTPWPSRA